MPNPSEANPGEFARASPAPRVRVPSPKDAERLAEINLVTWRHAYAGIVPAGYLETLDPGRLRDRWLERIQDPPRERVCFVAEVDDVVAAYSIGGGYRVQQDAEHEDTAGWGELYALYTHPDYQGRGAGQAAQSVLLAALAERGCSVAALWMLRDNDRTRRWYVDRGWRLDGATSLWLGAGEPLVEVRLTRLLSTPQDVVQGSAPPG
ncbi:MAG: GNAT family N-acetyltransferase [Nocardioidaceae bacterium]